MYGLPEQQFEQAPTRMSLPVLRSFPLLAMLPYGEVLWFVERAGMCG